MPMCHKGLVGAYEKFETVTSYEARDMLTTYLGNLEKGGEMAKALVDVAELAMAPDVANYAAEITGQMYKNAWYIKAMLRHSGTQPSE